jgi:hypothetical protein
MPDLAHELDLLLDLMLPVLVFHVGFFDHLDGYVLVG